MSKTVSQLDVTLLQLVYLSFALDQHGLLLLDLCCPLTSEIAAFGYLWSYWFGGGAGY